MHNRLYHTVTPKLIFLSGRSIQKKLIVIVLIPIVGFSQIPFTSHTIESGTRIGSYPLHNLALDLDGDGDVKYYLSFDITVLSWTGSELTSDSRLGGTSRGGMMLGTTNDRDYTAAGTDGYTLTLNLDGSLTIKRYGSSSYNWKLVAMFKWM